MSLLPGMEQYTTGRGQVDELERYYTPDALARWVVDRLPWHDTRYVLEPHAGGGAFLRALEQLPLDALHACDIDGQCWAVQEWGAGHGNFLAHTEDGMPIGRYDRVVGNPPFSTAEAHVERALQVAAEVVYLLPVSRLETPSRQAFYASTPLRSVTLLGERVWPGSRQIGLFWWDCCHQGPPTLDFASWRTP